MMSSVTSPMVLAFAASLRALVIPHRWRMFRFGSVYGQLYKTILCNELLSFHKTCMYALLIQYSGCILKIKFISCHKKSTTFIF